MIHRPPQNLLQKPSINQSFSLTNKLNKSRSLLKNSIMRCGLTSDLKANNEALAHSLASVKKELLEVNTEKNRLTRENYDLLHTGKFRAYNYSSFMMKFSELSQLSMALLTQAYNVSDCILEMQSHPFIIGKIASNEIDITSSEIMNPTPFLSKDKIPRSPLVSLQEVNDSHGEISVDKLENLYSKITKLQNQSNHLIQNLSVDANTSSAHKMLKPDTLEYNIPSPIQHDSRNNSFQKSIKMRQGATKNVIPKSESPKVKKISRRKKNSKYDDPIVLSLPKCKTAKGRKKASTIKSDIKESNKDEYIKHKEKDAYHLSINETINTSVLPSSLNEFTSQQKNNIHENVKIDLVQENKMIKSNEETYQESVIRESKENDKIKEIDIIKITKKNILSEDKKIEQMKRKKRTDDIKRNKVLKYDEELKENVENITIDNGGINKATAHNIKLPQQVFLDDDDDFILKSKDKVKKRNILDDSLLDMDVNGEGVVVKKVRKRLSKSNISENFIEKDDGIEKLIVVDVPLKKAKLETKRRKKCNEDNNKKHLLDTKENVQSIDNKDSHKMSNISIIINDIVDKPKELVKKRRGRRN